MITAGTFGITSIWASTTKKDLSGWGSFLFIGLIGIIIASVVNMFLGSPMIDWVVSILGVGIFVGLTAYDTQQLRAMVLQAANEITVSKMVNCPVDFAAWRESWRVFATAMVMLRAANVEELATYEDGIVGLCMVHASSWSLTLATDMEM